MRVVIVAIVLCARVAAADPEHWYDGEAGRRRLTHLGLVVGGGALYLSSELIFKDWLAPDTCRICAPPALDREVRDALVWRDSMTAVRLGDVTGYVVAPAFALGITLLASSGVAQRIDDVIPILEAGVASGLVNQVAKFASGRQRPSVRFGDPRPPDVEDNLSFYSGHVTLAFAVATSAGIVAQRRGYRTAPWVWTIGYALAATTGYLRIAGDRHYLTDVVVGALTGTAIGFLGGFAYRGTF
jgi:membrane-associated phospholipid phosphatase